ncbi:MAG: SDR family NAD(P)-dependent oxidoreductase, partial [Pseudomonadota bacterium]
MNEIDLTGRCAVITGGAQGIGRAIAERFLDSGAAVCLWDQDKALVEQTADELSGRGRIHSVVADVTDLPTVEQAVRETEKALAPIDILVANAGIAGAIGKVWECPADDWRQVIDIDLNGVFYCCRAVAPGMIERNYGRIVNVASIAGKEGNPNAAAYSASKGGVIALT